MVLLGVERVQGEMPVHLGCATRQVSCTSNCLWGRKKYFCSDAWILGLHALLGWLKNNRPIHGRYQVLVFLADNEVKWSDNTKYRDCEYHYCLRKTSTRIKKRSFVSVPLYAQEQRQGNPEWKVRLSPSHVIFRIDFIFVDWVASRIPRLNMQNRESPDEMVLWVVDAPLQASPC